MGRSNTFAAMLAGAAMAGGLMYLKKISDSQQKAATDTLDAELNELKRDQQAEDASWHATYTIGGEELSPEELKARFKEETAKAVENFRADAKVASDEILTGLKKAIADVKVAVEGAKKAAAERRAAVEAEFTEEGACCCEGNEDSCCCEGNEAACCCEEIKEDLKETAKDFAEGAKDLFSEMKEAVEETAEEVKDQI